MCAKYCRVPKSKTDAMASGKYQFKGFNTIPCCGVGVVSEHQTRIQMNRSVSGDGYIQG